MNYPEELKYVESHEWVREEGTEVTVGITDFAQDALGDLVFVNLPEVGDTVAAGEPFADVESVKAVSDVYSPVSGVVLAINEELMDAPEKINEDPYGSWFVRIGELTDHEAYLNAQEYEELTLKQED